MHTWTHLTYGELPSREMYDVAWEMELQANDHDVFRFGNDKRVGTTALSQDQLWEELQKANREYRILLNGDTTVDPEQVGSWISSVLGCLGTPSRPSTRRAVP